MPLLRFAMQSSLISGKNLPAYYKSPSHNGYTNLTVLFKIAMIIIIMIMITIVIIINLFPIYIVLFLSLTNNALE